MDFGLHYIDLASMFGRKPIRLSDLHHTTGVRGMTASITGTARFENYPVQILLTQGHGASRHWVTFHFANYVVRLTFHPDTFSVLQGPDLMANRFVEGFKEVAAVARWAFGKFGGKDPDDSHVKSFQEGIRVMRGANGSSLAPESLSTIYELLGEIGARVYEQGDSA